MSDLDELERRVGVKYLEAVAARTPEWQAPEFDFDMSSWAGALQQPLPAGTMQFPREQWASYPNKRTLALILADRLLDSADELTDEQWLHLGLVMQYGGKTRIA